MPFVIDLPPGVSRNGTQYQVKGRWYDANQVRWFDGILRPIGGWNRVVNTPLTGKCRAMISWAANSGSRWLAMGTNLKLYATGGADQIFDITPVGLTAGTENATESLGYGGGLYGVGTYGTARVGGTFLPPSTWHLDTWGEYLVGCSDADGRLFEWTLTGSPAAPIANAPVNCRGLIVTEERHLVALGPNNNVRRVAWSDKEDNTVWTPTAENEAGGFELQTHTAIQCACRVRAQVLILTQSDAHVLLYVGDPFTYGRERVGVGCGIISKHALISVESRAFWMGESGFWEFDGATTKPLACEVSDFVFKNMSPIQKTKVTSGHNPLFGEVWWFYPSTDAIENDRYVVYNYRENHWTIGAMPRVAWDGGEVFGYPHAVGVDGYLYRHEDGWLADGVSRVSSIYAESGAIEGNNGERVIHVNQLIPDEGTQGETQITFKTRYTPSGAEFSFGPYSIRADGYTDTRFSGRQMVVRITPTVDDDFRIGVLRTNAFTEGKR